MKYDQIVAAVNVAGHYITDPIGKCLRTTSKRKGHRIDLEYKGSETFAAFKRREDLSIRFDSDSAVSAYLDWIEVPGTGERSGRWPILVDRTSGIIQESIPDGSHRYGYLADVQGCIHYT